MTTAAMRIITVRQPHAWAIIHGGKDIENRSRNIAGDYRGTLAIHAGLAKYEQHNLSSETHRATHGDEVDTSIVFGAIIGTVELVGVHESAINGCGTGEGFGTVIPQCSEWAHSWSHHLVLANPRPLITPIPFTGALGLRTLPSDVEALVLAGLR